MVRHSLPLPDTITKSTETGDPTESAAPWLLGKFLIHIYNLQLNSKLLSHLLETSKLKLYPQPLSNNQQTL